MDAVAVVTLVVGGLGVFVTIITSVMVLSYRMGTSAARIDRLEVERVELREKLSLIFEKLDALSQVVPHRCDQMERITRLETRQQIVYERLATIDERILANVQLHNQLATAPCKQPPQA